MKIIDRIKCFFGKHDYNIYVYYGKLNYKMKCQYCNKSIYVDLVSKLLVDDNPEVTKAHENIFSLSESEALRKTKHLQNTTEIIKESKRMLEGIL